MQLFSRATTDFFGGEAEGGETRGSGECQITLSQGSSKTIRKHRSANYSYEVATNIVLWLGVTTT